MVERISRRTGLGPKTGNSVSKRLTTELPGLLNKRDFIGRL